MEWMNLVWVFGDDGFGAESRQGACVQATISPSNI